MSIRRNLLKNPVIGRFFFNLSSPSNKQEYTSFVLPLEQIQKIGNTISLSGYILLALTLIDYIFLIVPPRLFNPAWELNVIGHLIESVWAPILGFLLILFRMPDQKIYTGELKRLSIISKLALLVAIIYFLLIPLIISDTARIYRDRNHQFSSLITQQQTQLSKIEQQLGNLSDTQVTQAFGKSSVVSPNDSGEIMREKLLKKFQLEQSNNRSKVAQNKRQSNVSLVKNSVKWGIGALLSGLFFVYIWSNSKWTRNKMIV
ncbi:MAG: hypothetical protein Tsb0014_21220 [Pleurocapsa sp.]